MLQLDGDCKTKYKDLLSDKSLRLYLVMSAIVSIGLLAEFVFFQYGVLKIVRYLILTESLFVIGWIDIKKHIIKNNHLFMMILARLAILLIECLTYPTLTLSIITSALLGVVIAILVFGGCYLIARGGMGAGDVKLMAVVGFYVGSSVIMQVMLLTVVVAAIYSIVKLIRKKTKLKDEIAFAPFVLIGTVLAFALGV